MKFIKNSNKNKSALPMEKEMSVILLPNMNTPLSLSIVFIILENDSFKA